jgi:hypothetical protein
MILPLAFSGCCTVRIGRIGSIPDCGGSIPSRGESMSSDMGGCQCLTCGPGGGPGGIILLYVAGGGMGSQGSFPHIVHPEDTGTGPFSARLYRCPGAGITRVFFLEVMEHPLRTVSSPDCEGFLVGPADELCNRSVQGCNRDLWSSHILDVYVEFVHL